jgi:hypothetical protein
MESFKTDRRAFTMHFKRKDQKDEFRIVTRGICETGTELL